jgi:hypothetical protein
MFAPKQKHFDGTDYSQHPSVKDVFKREPLDPLTALADRLKKAIKEWHFPMDLSDELNAIATALRQHAERGGWVSVEDVKLESGQYFDVSYRTKEGKIFASSGAKWDGHDWWDEDGDCLRDYGFEVYAVRPYKKLLPAPTEQGT